MMQKLILIALIFISGCVYADVYKVQAVIKLETKSAVVETNLIANKSKLAGIHIGKANAEVSVVSRDDKVLSINLFFNNLEEAKKVYDYLVKQAGDMQNIDSKESVFKSRVLLLKTTNHIKTALRRKGDKCINSYVK